MQKQEKFDEIFSNKVLAFKKTQKLTKYCSQRCELFTNELNDNLRNCLNNCGKNYKLTYNHFVDKINSNLIQKKSGFT